MGSFIGAQLITGYNGKPFDGGQRAADMVAQPTAPTWWPAETIHLLEAGTQTFAGNVGERPSAHRLNRHLEGTHQRARLPLANFNNAFAEASIGRG
jgi:hypothetical protein